MIKQAYKQHSAIIKQQLLEFQKEKTNEDYFYEACFCVLAVQSKGRKADYVVQELKKKDFYNKKAVITPLLKQHIRFHNNKTKYLENLKVIFPEVLAIIHSTKKVEEKRMLLVKTIKGFGMKEASHYLRNTGHTGLAILDRHILRNMEKYGAINEIPTLTEKNYLKLEEKLRSFSKKQGINFDELDLLFWAMNTGEVFK